MKIADLFVDLKLDTGSFAPDLNKAISTAESKAVIDVPVKVVTKDLTKDLNTAVSKASPKAVEIPVKVDEDGANRAVGVMDTLGGRAGIAAGGIGDLSGALEAQGIISSDTAQIMGTAAATIQGIAGVADLAVVGMELLKGATVLQTGAQAALNFVMSANPIGIVVVAIAGLVAAFVILFNKNKAFHDLVIKVWDAIKGAIKGVVDWLVNTAWPWIKGVWDKIKAAVSVMGTVIGKVWENIKTAIGNAWAWIRDNVFKFFTDRITALKQNLQFLRDKAGEVWDWIKQKLGAAWAWIRDNVFAFFVQRIDNLKRNFGLMKDAIGKAWDWVKQKLSDGWTWVRDHVFKFFTDGVNGLKKTFDTVVGEIGKIWDTLKSVLKTPIKIAFDFVNANVVGPINTVLGKLPGGLQIPELPHLARGGQVWGAGSETSDSIPAMLSNGEYVIRAKQARKHKPLLDRINGSGLPGFADGGFLDTLGNIYNSAKDKVTGAFDFGKELLAKGARKAAEALLGPLRTGVNNLIGEPTDVIRAMLRGTSDKLFNGIFGLSDEKDKAMAAAAAAAPKVGPSGSSGGAERWRAVALSAMAAAGLPSSYIGLLLHRMNVESGGNPNAINLWDSNARAGHPSQGLMQTIPGTFNAYAGPYRHLGITNPFANIYAAIKYTLARYGLRGIGGAWGGSMGYDAGGWLEKGRTMTVNGTGKPEAVLTGQQWAQMERLITAVESGRTGGAPLIGHAVIRENVDLERYERQRAFRERSTRV